MQRTTTLDWDADGKKPKKNFQASWVNTEDAKIISLLRAS
jgi:hypothetical protein